MALLQVRLGRERKGSQGVSCFLEFESIDLAEAFVEANVDELLVNAPSAPVPFPSPPVCPLPLAARTIAPQPPTLSFLQPPHRCACMPLASPRVRSWQIEGMNVRVDYDAPRVRRRSHELLLDPAPPHPRVCGTCPLPPCQPRRC